jgi:hypothetical protein
VLEHWAALRGSQRDFLPDEQGISSDRITAGLTRDHVVREQQGGGSADCPELPLTPQPKQQRFR